MCAYLIGVAGIARPSAGCCEDGETASRTCMPILRSLGTGWRGVVREPADACVSHPRCADTCSSAGSYGCARPASWVCASICELPFAVTVPLVREPTDVCASSWCCRKPAPICGFLLVRGSGLSDLMPILRLPGTIQHRNCQLRAYHTDAVGDEPLSPGSCDRNDTALHTYAPVHGFPYSLAHLRSHRPGTVSPAGPVTPRRRRLHRPRADRHDWFPA